MSVEQLNSPLRSGHHNNSKGNEGDDIKTDGRGPTGTGGKRKYRRHPKVSNLPSVWRVCVLFRFSRTWLIICATLQADENAPERPPSAYVIFSNSERRRSSIEIAY